MKHLLGILFFILFFNFLSGQNKKDVIDIQITKGDSLNKLKQYTAALAPYELALAIALDKKDKEQQATLYKKTGVQYYRIAQYDISENRYQKGLRLDSISKTAADLYFNLFLVKRKLNQQDSTLLYLEKSLNLYKTLEQDKSAYNVFLSAGIVYKEVQLYDKALLYLIEAYNGFTRLKNENKLAYVCTTIANIQNRLKNYYQALNYHKQALKLHKKLNNPQGIGRCYSNMANVYGNLNLVDSAMVNFQKALSFTKEKNGQYAIALSNLANTYKKTGDIDLANKSLKESIEINTSLKDTLSLLYNYNGMISLFLERNNLPKAKYYIDKAALLVPSVSDNIAILNYYESEVEYHQKKKNYKMALAYQLKYSTLYETVYDIEQTEIVQNLQARFDYEKKENEILKLNLINKDSQLLLAEKNESIKSKNLTLIILAIIMILLIVTYYLFSQKQKATIQSAKIEKLEAIYESQETIKKRIARDLHDIITTNFDGLRLRILALKPTSKKPELIDGITTDIKNVNRQIRVVSHRLYPLEMQMGNNRKFKDIVKSRLTEFQLYGNIFVDLEDSLPEAINDLNLSTQNNFYGILLEVLNNIEKHAHATKLTITCYTDSKDYIHFVFLDNGIGIEHHAKEGIGLLNIKQRCEIINGSCNIQKVDSGTEVHISFPLKKNET
ncbi:hypothetical protein GCM10023311_20600 [Flaviramulus aquimarinus]|uniref:Histidine kinase/HSP90-like ATPase domain-containing protein n=1 Tax=Flaviramulus aquimarinus TaxID=1170456 RepID=A0ABP9F8B3_9FLAO